MSLSDGRADALAQAIASTVPLFLLAEVVEEQAIVNDFATLRKSGSGTPDDSYLALVLAVVKAYDQRDLAARLAESLYRRGRRDDAIAEAIAPFAVNANGPGAAQQAALALRAVGLRMPELSRFLDECEPRICVLAGLANIAGQAVAPSGTGFLVGPDLVLTARHVLKHHIADGRGVDPKQAGLFAFFDHFEGEPITDPLDQRIAARRVAFHKNWLVHEIDEMPFEGEFANPTPEQMKQLPDRLDTALVRLAEPIGQYARARGGGKRRSWFQLAAIAAAPREHDRIIIPQHPFGHALRIDFGYMEGTDQSATRIRYDTYTAKGTSGAPCFNQHFGIVGLHVADYRPQGIPISNQAIRFDRIVGEITTKCPELKPGPDLNPNPVENRPAKTRLWSVSRERADPRVILGRTNFLDWIDRATIEKPTVRADRIYAAVASTPRAGRSFSIEILRAARRETVEPIVTLGLEKLDLIPNSVPAFLAAIADQLRIPQSSLSDLPPRATENIPVKSKDGDKLNKWASDEVPRWFDKVLRLHRERIVDRRDDARAIVEFYEKEMHRSPPPEELAIATSPTILPDTRNRWPIGWIVLDNLNQDSLSKDVADLIAGLCGEKLGEAAVPDELRRLRWVFLGYKPDFIIDADACVELLDPMALGTNVVVQCMTSLEQAFDRDLSEEAQAGVELMLTIVEASKTGAVLRDPLRRLESLQDVLNTQARVRLQQIEADA